MTVKQILYSLQNCSLGQSAARAPTPATPHHPQFPHKMRRRHLESVSAAPSGRGLRIVRIQPQLSEKGVLGHSPKCVLVWGPGGTQGPLGKGGAAERWRVTPSVSGVTRHGAQPATPKATTNLPSIRIINPSCNFLVKSTIYANITHKSPIL